MLSLLAPWLDGLGSHLPPLPPPPPPPPPPAVPAPRDSTTAGPCANPCVDNAACAQSSTCSGQGLCYDLQVGLNQALCVCDPGYSGDTCGTNTDDCASNPCYNGGACVDTGANSFNCTCASGWTGATCTTDVNDCSPSPCLNGGTCVDAGTNSYVCSCASGFASVGLGLGRDEGLAGFPLRFKTTGGGGGVLDPQPPPL